MDGDDRGQQVRIPRQSQRHQIPWRDARLPERLRTTELLPLGSRIRRRLALDYASRDELCACLDHLLSAAGNPSLKRSIWLVDQLARPDFAMGVDALHFVRSGASMATLAALDPRYFGIAQICDAIGTHTSEDYIADVHNREVPGQGELSLREILSAVPQSIKIEIEVPAAHRRKAGVSAEQHVRDVVEGTRAIVATLTPSR